MNGFDSLIAQRLPVSILKNFLIRGTIPHALLFSGIDGIGKQRAAAVFAMACNCHGVQPLGASGGTEGGHLNPCGECPACRKIQSNNHPDVLHIAPTGERIRIDRIRELHHTLSLRPYEARRRVAVVTGAQTMTPGAGNAFLKMLEEPPDRTVLILIASDAAALLPTIRSRCHHIRFHPLAAGDIAERLAADTGLDMPRAQVIGAMSGGSYDRALALTEGGDRSGWMAERNWVISELAVLPGRPLPVVLGFAEALAARKEGIADLLHIIAGWYRDLVVCRYDPGAVINRDMTGAVTSAAAGIRQADAATALAAVHTAEKQIQQNANPRLALEAMALRLAGWYTDEKSGHPV